jgi:hypothetical protein
MTAAAQGRAAASDLRPPEKPGRTSCGFCEGGHGQPRGVCQDVDGRCKGHLAGFRQGHCRQSRRLVDVRVLGRRARHLAGSMCRFAVQRVLARAFRNISALARAPAGGDGTAGSVAAPFSFMHRTNSLAARAVQPKGIVMVFRDCELLGDLSYITSTCGARASAPGPVPEAAQQAAGCSAVRATRS